MSAIEDAARAVWAIQREELDKCDMELEDVRDYHDTYKIVREVLLSVRIPNVAMLDAMKANIGPLSYMWTAAIDVILSEDE